SVLVLQLHSDSDRTIHGPIHWIQNHIFGSRCVRYGQSQARPTYAGRRASAIGSVQRDRPFGFVGDQASTQRAHAGREIDRGTYAKVLCRPSIVGDRRLSSIGARTQPAEGEGGSPGKRRDAVAILVYQFNGEWITGSGNNAAGPGNAVGRR